MKLVLSKEFFAGMYNVYTTDTNPCTLFTSKGNLPYLAEAVEIPVRALPEKLVSFANDEEFNLWSDHMGLTHRLKTDRLKDAKIPGIVILSPIVRVILSDEPEVVEDYPLVLPRINPKYSSALGTVCHDLGYSLFYNSGEDTFTVVLLKTPAAIFEFYSKVNEAYNLNQQALTDK